MYVNYSSIGCVYDPYFQKNTYAVVCAFSSIKGVCTHFTLIKEAYVCTLIFNKKCMYASVVKGKSVYTWKNLKKLGLKPETKNAQQRSKESQKKWKTKRKSNNDSQL
jgi:hypothetical protein